jgi:hypothetical protein
MNVDMEISPFLRIADRTDLAYDEKLAEYSGITEEYFATETYNEFCAEHLSELDDIALNYFSSTGFDDLLVKTVLGTFPTHEHEKFVAHYRGLVGAWCSDQTVAQ